MRDDDDDLLRAAEELGIDLSGVRAGAPEAGAEDTEEAGEAGEPSGEAAEAAVDGEMDAGDEQLSVETDDELALEDLDDLGEEA
jgi:DNA-directed RNA polymerase subunit beta